MYKGRFASAARGAHRRHPMSAAKRASLNTPPVFSKGDEVHFEHAPTSRQEFVGSLRSDVLSLAKSGFRKPRDVARLLNRMDRRTACGEQWTPRLTSLLLSFMFTARDQGAKGAARPLRSEPSRRE